MVKNPPVRAGDQEMQVRSLDREDRLEEDMATQSSILAWRIPWAEEPGGLQSMRSQSRTRLSDLACTRLFKSPISKYSHVAGRVPTYVFLGDNPAPWLPRWHSGKEFACQCR